jgi:argininosuccinate synthase
VRLGQGEDLQAVKQKAIKTGASKVVIGDLREEFVKNYVFPMLRANAVYEGSYLLGTSIARPLIAKGQIDVAVKEKADAVSHGATGKGNDQVRFELTYYALKPAIKVIAPWREWDLNARSTLIDYAKRHGIPVPVTKAKPYSTDRNLFHISTRAASSRSLEGSRRRTCSSGAGQWKRRPTVPSVSRSITCAATRWRWAAENYRRPICWRG